MHDVKRTPIIIMSYSEDKWTDTDIYHLESNTKCWLHHVKWVLKSLSYDNNNDFETCFIMTWLNYATFVHFHAGVVFVEFSRLGAITLFIGLEPTLLIFRVGLPVKDQIVTLLLNKIFFFIYVYGEINANFKSIPWHKETCPYSPDLELTKKINYNFKEIKNSNSTVCLV